MVLIRSRPLGNPLRRVVVTAASELVILPLLEVQSEREPARRRPMPQFSSAEWRAAAQ
jgi:hypothetical protein